LAALLSLPLLLAALVFVLVLAFINFRGIAESVKLNLAMSLTEIAGLVLVVGVVVLGSVSYGVLHHAPCPVLVTR
jgi:amino acid transporter